MKLPNFFIYGLAGGIVGAGVALVVSGSSFLFWQPAAVGQPSPSFSISPEPTTTPQPDTWQLAIAEANQSSVAVQVFQDAQLTKSGGGIIVSSDGLVLTAYDLVPTGQTAYQILYGDKILRATVVARRYQDNLALLKVEGSEFNISDLKDEANLASGKEVMITGLFMALSKPTQFAQRAVILYQQGKDIVLDTSAKSFLNGAQVVNSEGKCLGIISLRSNKVLLTPVSAIKDFIDGYFSSQK